MPWADQYPKAWIVPLRGWIGDFMNWLIREFDLGLFTFRELTRAFAWLLGLPFDVANWALWEGIEVSDEARIPPLSWIAHHRFLPP